MNTKNNQKTHKLPKNKNSEKPYSDLPDLVKKQILGVGVTNANKENILKYITKSIQDFQKPYYIVTPNPEMLVLAQKNSDFKHILNNAKIALNDGVGVGVAAQLLGQPLEDRFTGVEFVENLCEKIADWPITVGFLGAGPNVAEKTAECLRLKFPNLHVVFASDHWTEEKIVLKEKELRSKNKELSKLKSQKTLIHNSSFSVPDIDILFIALGVPKQEFWMASHLGKIPVKVMVGIGGAFDYISGLVPRAPIVVRRFGFEWLYRLVRQPWRWKRQLALIEFGWLILKEKL